jgi:hypothetical protein
MNPKVPSDSAAGQPFRPFNPPQCSKRDCEATAVFRMGELDICGRHTNWAITRQVGEMQRREMSVGRYQRIT